MLIKLLVSKVIKGIRQEAGTTVPVSDGYGQMLIANNEAIEITTVNKETTKVVVSTVGNAADNQVVYSGTVNTTGVLSSILTTDFSSLSVQCAGSWSGNIKIEISNDNINWQTSFITSFDSIGVIDIITGNGIYYINIISKYVRINVLTIVGNVDITTIGKLANISIGSDALALALDSSKDTPLNVRLPKDFKQDNEGALLLSDMKGPIYWKSTNASTPLYIDCTGYTTVIIQKLTSGTVTPTISNDNVNFYQVFNIQASGGTSPLTTLTAINIYIIPVMAKWLRLVGPASATQCIIYLSKTPYNPSWSIQYTPTNIVQLGTTLLPANNASAIAYSLPIAGADSLKTPLARRILTDELGRIQIGTQNLQNSRQINPLGYDPTYLNVLAVKDISTYNGKTILDLLVEVITELKVLNHQMNELPKLIDDGIASTDSVDELRKEYED